MNIEELLVINPQHFGTKAVQAVNARNVWKWLEVKSEFSHWIKRRIYDGQFDEFVDYVIVKNNGVKNQQVTTDVGSSIEYFVSLDMAKHLCMLERNSKGKEARKYFIKMESELLERLNASKKAAFEKCNPTMILRNQSYRHQRSNSNTINSANAALETVPSDKRRNAQNYNVRNCVAITDRTPRNWRDEGRSLGLPRYVCRSAKEVARVVQPEMAASRSIADELVMDGIEESAAFQIGRALIAPCKMLFDAGYTGERYRSMI